MWPERAARRGEVSAAAYAIADAEEAVRRLARLCTLNAEYPMEMDEYLFDHWRGGLIDAWQKKWRIQEAPEAP